MKQRGKIYNEKRARQKVVFEGMTYFGTITPTDIDGFFEIHNKLFVLFELKAFGAKMPYGQRLALERLADEVGRQKEAVLFIAHHDTPPEKDVIAAEAIVVGCRYQGAWKKIDEFRTLKESIEAFIEYVGAK